MESRRSGVKRGALPLLPIGVAAVLAQPIVPRRARSSGTLAPPEALSAGEPWNRVSVPS